LSVTTIIIHSYCLTYLVLDISLLTSILITKRVLFVMSHFAILPYGIPPRRAASLSSVAVERDVVEVFLSLPVQVERLRFLGVVVGVGLDERGAARHDGLRNENALMGECGRELAAGIAAMLQTREKRKGAGTTHDYMAYLKYIGMLPPLLVRNAFTSQTWIDGYSVQEGRRQGIADLPRGADI
jgi:hypothetical protein